MRNESGTLNEAATLFDYMTGCVLDEIPASMEEKDARQAVNEARKALLDAGVDKELLGAFEDAIDFAGSARQDNHYRQGFAEGMQFMIQSFSRQRETC